MTVYWNVRNAILSQKGIRLNLLVRLKNMDVVHQEATELIGVLGLDTIKDVPASELSYGQQRALEVGVALASDPKLILLDEPTAGMTQRTEQGSCFSHQEYNKRKNSHGRRARHGCGLQHGR